MQPSFEMPEGTAPTWGEIFGTVGLLLRDAVSGLFKRSPKSDRSALRLPDC